MGAEAGWVAQGRPRVGYVTYRLEPDRPDPDIDIPWALPALAARGADLSGHDVFLLAWEANQALARLGVFATAAAFTLWSIDFLRRPGLEPKAIGGLGLLAGLVPATLLATAAINMHVAGAFAAYAAFAAWGAIVGVHLLRGQLEG